MHRQLPRSPRVVVLFILLSLLSMSSGCSGSAAAPSQFSSAEAAYETARQAFEKQDYAAAEAAVKTSLESGTLQPDLVESALLLRARSYIQLGKLQEADTELQQLQANAASLDQVWLAIAELKLKQNNPNSAREAVRDALKANPRLPIPPHLKP